MNQSELSSVFREIDGASDSMKRRVIHLIRSTVSSYRRGSVDELDIEADSVPEEVYHVIFHLLTHGVIPMDNERLHRDIQVARYTRSRSLHRNPVSTASLRWFAYHNLPNGKEHISKHKMTPSRETRRLLAQCRASGYMVLTNPPAYVGPARHFDRSTGDGLFALVPFRRGQMIMQFTGTVHDATTNPRFMVGKRKDYVINMRYMGRDFIVDPLDATHQRIQPPNYAAYINEPSPPPFDRMTNAIHTPSGRNVLIHRYNSKKGVLSVEFADGEITNVEPDDLSNGASRAVRRPPYRATCAWFDFPVPLDGLYQKVTTRGDGIRVYKRTELYACTVSFRNEGELLTSFEGHTNQVNSYEMHRTRVSNISVGDVLTLREERMEGLRRHGVVTRVDGNTWDVFFRVDSNAAAQLPSTVYAGWSSTQGYDVPFPCIHACCDVSTGDELLCLYSTPTPSRGLACRALLGQSDIHLPWYEYIE